MIPLLNFIPNSYELQLPKTFLGDKLENKWRWVIDGYNLPFEYVVDYLSSTLIGITVPGFELDTVQQIGVLSKQTNYLSPKPNSDAFGGRDVTLTFSMKDGLLNYFIVMDYLFGKNEYKTHNNFSEGGLVLSVKDSLGLRTSKIMFNEFIVKGTDGITLSKTDNSNGDNTFSLNCLFNYIEFSFEENDIENIIIE